MSQWLLRLGWLFMAAIALYLAGVTLVYYSFRSDIYFLLEKQELVFDPAWRTAFYFHITGGLMALATGAFQLSKRFRQKNIKLHRLLGKIYMGAILVLGAPSGLYMAFFAEGGWFARFGFIILSILWFVFTWLGLRAILHKRIQMHRIWMMRSYALTFAAVTLRLLVPILSFFLQMNPEQVLLLTPWVSWLFNLIVAEIFIVILLQKKYYKT